MIAPLLRRPIWKNSTCVLTIVAFSATAIAAVSFSHLIVDATQTPDGHKPKVIGDFANDGHPGVGALAGLDGFRLYRYPNWTSQLITNYSNGGGDEDAQAVDINGDGALDIVIGGLNGYTYWLENPLKQGRDPYTSTWNVHLIGSGHPSHDIVVGDINRDGKVDVATESGIYLQGATPDSWTLVGPPQIGRGFEGTSLANILGDGYLDIIAPYQNGTQFAWFENPAHGGGNPVTDVWAVHVIDAFPGFSGDMTSAAFDLNRDGRVDVAMTPMYNDGNLVWYEAPTDPRNGAWIKHTIGPMSYVHQGSLQVADFDGDGNPDIAFAEQEQSASKRIGVYFSSQAASSWSLQVLAATGGHNLKAGVVGNDSHPSLLCANHGFYGAPNPLELWQNNGTVTGAPPVISNVAAVPAPNTVTITWATDKAASSRVDYGTSTNYGGVASSSSLVTGHSLGLPGLSCGTLYDFKVTSADSSGNGASSPNATFNTGGCGGAGAPLSDSFNSSSLDTSVWTFVNPAGGSYSLSGTDLLLSVPGGSTHDPIATGTNNAVRMMQTIGNVDFDVIVKFDTIPTAQYSNEGVLVEQDGNNFLRFELYSAGSQAYLYGGTVIAGNETPQANTPLATGTSSFWLRVKRTGNSWTESWSTDGNTYTSVVTFTSVLAAARIGLLGANWASPASSAPPFTVSIDYFLSAGSNPGPPVISNVASAPSQSTATITWTTDKGASSRVDYGSSPNYGGVTSSSSLVTSHSLSLSGLTCGTQYNFEVTSTDSDGNSSGSPNAMFNTGNCGGSGGPQSDNFDSGPLNTLVWTFVNPAGGSYSMNGTQLLLSVPGGSTHDPNATRTNDAVRMMQTVPNVDFDVIVKFDSIPAAQYTSEGIIVEQDATDFLRFELYSDGNRTYLYGAAIISGNEVPQINAPVASGAPSFWLRVKRTGNSWTESWSTDGSNYTAGVTFAQSLAAARIGLLAGNYADPAGSTPAFTASMDYFFNAASPLVP
jgi:hypothetical protein